MIQKLSKLVSFLKKYNQEEKKTNYALSRMIHKNAMYYLCLSDQSMHLISCA